MTHDRAARASDDADVGTTTAGSYMGWGQVHAAWLRARITMGAKLAAPDKLCINVMGDAAMA